MPPIPTWFRGRQMIGRFLGSRIPANPADVHVIATAANDQPALATYRRDRDGIHHAHSIQVLTIAAAGITRVASFQDPALFSTFGLPRTLPDAETGPGREDP
jgi:RNA polymerase sigma-70 factor (ECF subfamily)